MFCGADFPIGVEPCLLCAGALSDDLVAVARAFADEPWSRRILAGAECPWVRFLDIGFMAVGFAFVCHFSE